MKTNSLVGLLAAAVALVALQAAVFSAPEGPTRPIPLLGGGAIVGVESLPARIQAGSRLILTLIATGVPTEKDLVVAPAGFSPIAPAAPAFVSKWRASPRRVVWDLRVPRAALPGTYTVRSAVTGETVGAFEVEAAPTQ